MLRGMTVGLAALNRLRRTFADPVRRYPGWVRALPSLVDDYAPVTPLLVEGKVPLNYFTHKSNFGDLISPWLVQQITGREVTVARRSKPHYVVIGSIINQATDQSILWGTGTYGTEGRSEVAANAEYAAVRGPLTQAKLSAGRGFGIPVPQVYGDPALLVPLYYQPQVPITHEYGVVVRWSERRWAKATYGPGVKLIDFGRADVEGVFRELLSCRKIITSSLHGLIVADAYGIPNAWLASTSPRGGAFKFYDYFASVNKFRRPHQFDLADRPVTAELLRDTFTFSGEKIDFDYRALLDASPFLRRRVAADRPRLTAVAAPRPRRGIGSAAGRKALLPSLGYFGGIAASHLSVPVDEPIARIRLQLPDGPGRLDLRGVELWRSGRRLPINEAKVTLAQSSDGGLPADGDGPFNYGGIRTAKGERTWWSATFEPRITADEIRIYNRRDGWGNRARSLTVAVAGRDGYYRTVHTVDSDRVVRQTLTLLRQLTDVDLDPAVLETEAGALRARGQVLAVLARRAGTGLLTAKPEEQRLLASLLRRQPLPVAQPLSEDEWTVLGHVLAAERQRLSSTKTSVLSYHRVLDSPEKLARLEAAMNEACAVLGIGPVTVARDGVTDAVDQGQSSGERATVIAEVQRGAREPSVVGSSG